MMHLRRGLAVAVLSCICALPCVAADWQQYGDLRYTCGLPGNGYGVAPDGGVGFAGAFHIGVPCAYTPSAGNYSASYYSSSTDTSLHFGFSGQEVNGTGHLGIGFGQPGSGIYISQTYVEERLSVNCWNLQWQVAGEQPGRPALAIGVLDVLNQRIGRDNTPHGGRSIYAVASQQLVHGSRPLFASIGFGTDRFSTPFGGLSWYPMERCNVGAEYDGFVFRPHVAYELYSSDAWTALGTIAWSDFERPMIGIGFAYSR